MLLYIRNTGLPLAFPLFSSLKIQPEKINTPTVYYYDSVPEQPSTKVKISTIIFYRCCCCFGGESDFHRFCPLPMVSFQVNLVVISRIEQCQCYCWHLLLALMMPFLMMMTNQIRVNVLIYAQRAPYSRVIPNLVEVGASHAVSNHRLLTLFPLTKRSLCSKQLFIAKLLLFTPFYK